MGYTSWQNVILGVSWSFLAAAVLLVAARIYVRTRISPDLRGWDDWTILTATVISIASSILQTILVNYGAGKHQQDVNPKNYLKISDLILIYTALITVGTMFVKLSLCLFILRLVKRTAQIRRIVKWLVTVNIIFCVPLTMATFSILVAEVVPVGNRNIIGSRRFNPMTVVTLTKVTSAVGVFTDFMTAAIPIIIVRRLQMPRNRKFAVYAVLALGFIIGAISIVKTVLIRWTLTDYTYDTTLSAPWASFEYNGGIIVTCLPTVRPLLKHLEFRMKSRSGSEKQRNSSYHGKSSTTHASHLPQEQNRAGSRLPTLDFEKPWESRPKSSITELLRDGESDSGLSSLEIARSPTAAEEGRIS